ncbi:hypothetical protein EBR96_09880, partial [bacterium]|nr:hypothetical protein [bacterium]
VFFLLTGGLEVCGKNTIEKRAAIAGFQSALIEFSKQFEFDVLENIYKIKPHPSTRIPDVIAELRSRLAGCFRPTEYSLSGKLKYHLIGDEICDRGPWPDTLMIDLLSIFNIFVISGPPVTVFESNHGIGYGLRLSDPPYKQHVQSYRNTIRMCFESPPQDAISQIIDHFETILVRRAEYLQLVGLHTMGTHFHVVTHAPAPYDAIQTVARELIKHPAIPSDYHASLQILADSAIDALTPGELGKCFETMNTAYRTLLKSQFQLISDALHSLPLKQAKSDILVARPDRETLCTLVIKTVQTKFVEGLQLTDTKPTAHSPLYLALAKLLEHRQAPTERWGNYGRIFGHSQVSVPFPLYHCLDTEQGKFACLWRQSNFPFETDPHHRVVTLPRPILVTDAGGAPLADRPLTPRE